MLRHRLPLALFTLAYVLGFTAWAVARGNTEFLFYAGVMVVLIGAVLLADRRVRFSPGVMWGLSVWGALHMAGGIVPIGGGRVLYDLILVPIVGPVLRFDQVVHAYGFGVTTVACWQALQGIVGPIRRAGPGLALLVACMGMGFGALNEVVEFTATLIMARTNVGDYVNNALDLVANMCGAGVAAGAIMIRARRRLSAPPASR